MSKPDIQIHYGYCPEFGDDSRAVYARVLITYLIGDAAPATVLNSVICRDISSCEFYAENHYCTLINEVAAKYRP